MAGKKILVVDDDTLLSRTIDLCLSKRGHEVKMLYCGADAVKYLFQEKPDSVLLDIRLPDCDGWFIARLLHNFKEEDKVPLIVMSVLAPDRRKVAEIKPYAYIQKPFDIEQLLQTVERSLSKDKPLDGEKPGP